MQRRFNSEVSFLGLQVATISLGAHVTFSCVSEERKRKRGGRGRGQEEGRERERELELSDGVSSYKDTTPIGPGTYPYDLI